MNVCEYKTETNSQIIENKIVVTKRERERRRDRFEV